MAKQSSYQKLKAENAKLHSDIRMMVKNPKSLEAETLKKQYFLLYDTEDAIWFGNHESKHNGILGLIEPVGVKRIPAKIKKR